MLRFFNVTLAGLAMLGISATAHATPLALAYDTYDAGGGLTGYDFTLRLDNNDGSWTAGNVWDWFIFGDAASAISPLDDFTFTDIDPSHLTSTSSGGHNGPTIGYLGAVTLPGWQPLAIGETLSWSGTSAAFLGQGDLLWSSLIVGGGASQVSFEVATLAVSEPSTIAGFGAGLTIMTFLIRRRRQSLAG